MIVCSCQQVSDLDIELALLDILNEPEAPIPTPGVVYRYMQKRMNCCGCAPLAVESIYRQVEVLEEKGLISRYVCAKARHRLSIFLEARAAARARTRRAPARSDERVAS